MPDELTQLLDAWGRSQASANKPGLLPPSPSAGYITAVRHTRYRRIAIRSAIGLAAAGALIFLVYAMKPEPKPQPTPIQHNPVSTHDR